MTKSERILREYESKLWKRHGIAEGSNLLYPLKWYINTGRASADYIHRLADAKSKDIVTILERGGSVEDVCRSIKNYLYR